MNKLEVSFPMIFELSNMSRNKITHVGVMDFSADINSAIIPQWILDNIDCKEGDFVLARYVNHLPKGTYVKLEPTQEEEFAKIEDDYKPILESVLRSFSSLTIGDVIQIYFNDSVFRFKVLDTAPETSIQINDVDLEVEIFTTKKGHKEDGMTEPDSKGTDTGYKLDDAVVDKGIITGRCDNCKKDVPYDSLERHKAFCYKNNIKCEVCGRLILKSQEELHFSEYHVLVTCSCGVSVQKFFLQEHKSTVCTHRLKKCVYCKLQFKLIELKDHQSLCGSRTDMCNQCNRPIKLRDFKKHRTSKCKYPTPPPIPERSFVDTMMDLFGFKPPK
eukprot:TRINITY_DN6884_c0_g1_i1.p1 TRINITY_DN6884_c0_g1~~TRINITY_DN6884_c0_g1_i1.p1  ORF type:complete len:330 (+),score=64.47 TRINITY_DN6884_c0_g1_i1:591-1580(+)